MNALMILDAHSHTFSDQAIVQIDALNPPEVVPAYCSVSIHPWDAHLVNIESATYSLQQAVEIFKPIAIGESGIDRTKKKETLRAQTELWELHLHIAKQLALPVVIHCVRAFGDLLPYLKANPSMNFIFHGYESNVQQTKQLLRYNIWISLGRVILRNPTRVKEIVSMVAPERLLIESDDYAPDIDLVFQQLNRLLETDEARLKHQLATNLKNAYKI